MFRFLYVKRVTLIIVVSVALGLTVRYLLVPKSFGEYGYYRGDYIAEAKLKTPVYQGKESCMECHDDIFQKHEKDVHITVQCENCHDNGQNHVRHFKEPNSGISFEAAQMGILKNSDTCLYCHRKLKARPIGFPQIDPAEHYAFLHVLKSKTTCFKCHSPHEPLFLTKNLNEARRHPAIRECTHCHEKRPTGQEPKGHPIIFECNYCHSEIAEDFKAKKHSFLSCTACHQVYKMSESAGFIFKNSNPKFCLMCHEDKDVVDSTKVPVFKQVDHYQKFGVDDLNMECYECHGSDNIHDLSKSPRFSKKTK